MVKVEIIENRTAIFLVDILFDFLNPQPFSEADGVDLIKIHIRSGKLTLMTYDGFETQPIPMLRERVKINLHQRTVDFFDYGYGDYDPLPLYWKSRLIDASFSDYDKQRSFDKRLAGLNILELSERHGPSLENLMDLLRIKYILTIKGYRFFKAKNATAPSCTARPAQCR